MTKLLQRFGCVAIAIFVPLVAFSQSPAHSSIPIKNVAISKVVMPSIPFKDGYSSNKNESFQFAYPFELAISKDDVACDTIQDSIYYNVEIVSEGAYSLNLIFENVQIPQSAYLCIYGEDTLYSQCYYSDDVNKYGILPTQLVPGETIYVRYVEPMQCSVHGTWTIVQLAHDFTNAFLKESELKSSSAATCNVDINCSEGAEWQLEKRAVCKLLIQGVTFCTGTLINNTARDNTPYVLTANHCIASESKALRTVFYFDYENESCGSEPKTAKTISGATLVATSPDGKVDFSLLKLNKTPSETYNPYYAGWTTATAIEKGTACIHHPKGDVKKISIDESEPTTVTFKTSSKTYATDAHWKISKWEVGTTEGGSSGSALFNSDHLVIGTLSGGEADCAKPVNDFFSKFSMAWDYYDATTAQLKPWLDPINLGVTKCSAFDPYLLPNNVLTNIGLYDTLQIYTFDGKASGTWTGENELGWHTYAEKMLTTKSIYDIIYSGKIDTTEDLSNVRFVVWSGENYPEKEIFSTTMKKSMVKDSQFIYVSLNTPLQPNGVFWVGYELLNNTNAFTSYLSHVDVEGSLYVKHNKGWVNTEKLGFLSHLAVIMHVIDNPEDITERIFEEPFYTNNIVAENRAMVTDELFAIDSLGIIPSKTYYYKLSTKTVSNLSGPNELDVNCFANKYEIIEPNVIRGLKIAVADVPDSKLSTDIVLWRGEEMQEELGRKTISNALLSKDHFNQIHFDSLILVDTVFYCGFCFDTCSYENNISVYMYEDVESKVDGYFHYNGMWTAYSDYSLLYNIAIQPIVAKTMYHFNPDSLLVLKYPLTRIEEQTIQGTSKFIVYPTICTNNVYIRFIQNIFTTIDIRITDVQGKSWVTGTYIADNGHYTIPIDALPAGLFTISISTEYGEWSEKILHLIEK